MANLVALLVTGLALVVTSSQGTNIVVEKGQIAELSCNVSNTASSVTWQLLDLMDGFIFVNLSTCRVWNNACDDISPALYTSSIANSVTTLKVNGSARVNQQEIQCLADDDELNYFILDVYSWPTKPVCRQKLTNSDVEYMCTTTNVYPFLNAKIHRRLVSFGNDSEYFNSECSAIPNKNDPDGDDYSVSCTISVPLSDMRLNNTVYVEMYAYLLDESVINKSPVVSDDMFIRLNAPTVGVYSGNCPVGPGVRRKSVLTGTTATCKCLLATTGIPPGFARWYDQNGDVVGSENTTDRSSTLTFSYNASDPNQSYQCRPETNLSSEYVHSVTYSPSFLCSYTALEKGQSTTIQCSVLDTVSNITWQLSNGLTVVNISTCSFVDNTCTSLSPLAYNGFIVNSDGIKVAGLTVKSARVNETRFSILSDVENYTMANELEVYAWPKTPNCVEAISGAFLQITCTTDNVYPSVVAELYRLGSNLHSYLNDSGCALGKYGSGSEGDYTASCTWMIPIETLSPEETFFAEMSSNVSININRTVVYSNDWVTKLSFPQPILSSCPSGPGVLGDAIQIGTIATCKCVLHDAGFPAGFARWYTIDNEIVGAQNATDGSSTLTLAYNSSDPNPHYQCRPYSALGDTGSRIVYSPRFVSPETL